MRSDGMALEAKRSEVTDHGTCNGVLRCQMEFRRVPSRMVGAAVALLGLGFLVDGAEAASSRFCEGGGFVLTQQTNTVLVRGRHVGFDVDLRTMAVRNWTLTGAPSAWSSARR